MKLWRRASAAFKDTSSICLAKLSKRTPFRHPQLDTLLIKATSHDEFSIDYKNAQRVFAWARTSPSILMPLLLSLSNRVEKTRNWVVALKSLMLMHGLLCSKSPLIQTVHSLPFDLSNFIDGHSTNSPRTWGLCAFIRAYFAYLDRRLAFNSSKKKTLSMRLNKEEYSMGELLDELERSQALLDLLMQIRPEEDMRNGVLVLEAMDCTLVEIFDIYSRICNGVAAVLMGIYAANKGEAAAALRVLHKAASQGAELASYFEFCREVGVLKASEFPVVEQIPDEDIQDLERIIRGVSRTESTSPPLDLSKAAEVKESEFMKEMRDPEKKSLKTVITDNWVVFDEEFQVAGGRKGLSIVGETNSRNPFEDSLSFPPLLCGYNDSFTNSTGGLMAF